MASHDAEDLIDYEEDDETLQPEPAKTTAPTKTAANGAQNGEDTKKGSYVGIHSTGFRDFLLKPELLRAITDCGTIPSTWEKKKKRKELPPSHPPHPPFSAKEKKKKTTGDFVPACSATLSCLLFFHPHNSPFFPLFFSSLSSLPPRYGRTKSNTAIKVSNILPRFNKFVSHKLFYPPIFSVKRNPGSEKPPFSSLQHSNKSNPSTVKSLSSSYVIPENWHSRFATSMPGSVSICLKFERRCFTAELQSRKMSSWSRIRRLVLILLWRLPDDLMDLLEISIFGSTASRILFWMSVTRCWKQLAWSFNWLIVANG